MAKQMAVGPGATYSRKEAARALGVSLATLDRWIGRGVIRANRVGPKIIRVPTAEVVRVLNSDKAQPTSGGASKGGNK